MAGYEAATGINVSNYYGARDTGYSVGTEPNNDGIWQLGVTLTAASIANGFVPPVVIPRGAHFLRYILRVDEAFNLGGTTPTVIVGGTAPATNGVILTEAELEAIGTKIPASTGTGTWAVASATGTTAAEKVDIVLGGTLPVFTTNVGKAELIAEYIFETKI